MAVLLLLAALAAPADARACWSTPASQGIDACRRAMALALPAAQAAVVEHSLATKLISAGKMEEAVAVYREGVRRRPAEAEAHRRLGAVLLQAVSRPADAEPVLREAVRLDAAAAHGHGLLAMALAALDRPAEAVAAFEAAVARDARYLEARPASRAAYEEARAGRRWPPAR